MSLKKLTLGLCALALTAGFPPLVTACSRASAAHVTGHYSAVGVVRSFGPNRGYVNIAHEEIPGFMKAMTMPFVGTPAQIGALAEGDHVTFEFDAMDDGNLVLRTIRKQP